MRSGALRHSVIIQRPSSTSVDTMGHPTGGWAQYAERRASLEPLGGRELLVATERFGTVSHRIRLRYTPGITPDMRVLFRRTHDTLSSGVTSTGDVTLGVTDGADFPPAENGSYRIRVDDEIMLVTAGHQTTSWTVTRAYDATSATTHDAAANLHLLGIADIVAATVIREKKHEMVLMTAEEL